MSLDNPGVFVLAAQQITAAAGPITLTPITNLDGMTAVTIEANFQYGSGGTTCTAIVVTTFDDGVTWRHVARFDFTTSDEVKSCELSGLLSRGVSSYADLGSEGVNDGLLGNQLCAIITSTGTYTNTVLSLRASVR